jgi:hypothetical protein
MAKEKRKSNGAIWKIVALVVTVVVVALGVAKGYGVLCNRVDTVEMKADTALAKADSNEKTIIGIEADLKYILKGQDAQKQILEQIQKEVTNR